MASHDPCGTGSLLWSQEGLGLEILYEMFWGVECTLDVKASNVLLNFRLGVEGCDLGLLTARDLLDWR